MKIIKPDSVEKESLRNGILLTSISLIITICLWGYDFLRGRETIYQWRGVTGNGIEGYYLYFIFGGIILVFLIYFIFKYFTIKK